MKKFAIIGKGFIYPRHEKAIKEVGGEVLMTCDSDPYKEADYSSYQEMKNAPDFNKVTHVIICTPNNLHYGMAKAFKDKIVLCEKPLTLSSEEAEGLGDNVFTVLQLRYHPEVKNLKKKLTGQHKVKMVIRVKRDEDYWKGWKGDDLRSGGILFNLGIHYFDLLIYLFGDEYTILNSKTNTRKATGQIYFKDTLVDYEISIKDTADGQDRYLEIDGQKYSFSKQDNLSFEDLHVEVYKDLLKGKGINPSEAAKSIKLVEKLKCK